MKELPFSGVPLDYFYSSYSVIGLSIAVPLVVVDGVPGEAVPLLIKLDGAVCDVCSRKRGEFYLQIKKSWDEMIRCIQRKVMSASTTRLP